MTQIVLLGDEMASLQRVCTELLALGHYISEMGLNVSCG
jgi:hypothetical protein